MSGPRLLLLKTWVPAKKRRLKSGRMVDVKGYYDPRNPRRPYTSHDGSFVDVEGSRRGWLVPASHAADIVGQVGSPKEMRAKALEFAKKSIKGSYKNHESGLVVSVSRNAIDKCLSHGVDKDQFNALSSIPDILMHATFYRAAQPAKEKHANTEMFMYALAPVAFADGVRVAKVVMKKSGSGLSLYDLDLSKKVDGPDVTTRKKRVAVTSEPSGKGDSAVPHMSVSAMEKYVNDDGGVMKKSMLVLFRRCAA